MVKRIITTFVFLFILLCFNRLNCLAISVEDSNRMSNYITIIGRAIGCGMNTDTELIRVINWLQPKFSDAQEESMYTLIIAEFLEKNAREQSQGLSPDSCYEVRKQYNLINWP